MIYIASDHAGFERKELLKDFLIKHDYHIKDLGPISYNADDDYPDYAIPLAETVVKENERGVLLCGNAIGICMVANKVRGVRAGIGYSEYAAESMRTDDNTNILCLPGRALTDEEAKAILLKWLETDFSGEERHERRLEKVHAIEE